MLELFLTDNCLTIFLKNNFLWIWEPRPTGRSSHIQVKSIHSVPRNHINLIYLHFFICQELEFILSFKQAAFQKSFSRKCLVTRIFTNFNEISFSASKPCIFLSTNLPLVYMGVGSRNGHLASKYLSPPGM